MRSRFNIRSINFKIWMYLLVFTAVILALMWFLQIFFVNYYYESMKIDHTNSIANEISSEYEKNDLSSVKKKADSLSANDDLYIQIVVDGETVYPEKQNDAYKYEIEKAALKLAKTSGNGGFAKSEVTNEQTSRKSYTHAEYLNKKETAILYVVAPLYPVASTMSILRTQFIYIIFISLVMAFLLSIFLSSRISRPIRRLTRAAHRMARGDYGLVFPTSKGYTEIAELGETLNLMSTELERSQMMQRDLMANVSHDLRTPLTMIKSYAEMIRDLSGDDPVKRNDHLQVIIEEADRLNKLVNDMLALSAMQSGTMTLEMSAFDLKAAIDSVLAPYQVLIVNEGYDITFNCKDDIIVWGDEERIKQVVSNLLTNAVKYCGTDKKIFINVRRWGRTVHCEVIDHGVGIKPEELEHIWDRHYKTSSNHVRPTTGSGLGLSIVKEILQLHSSKFGVESKVGKGTTVWFELQVAQTNLIENIDQ